MRRLLTAVGFLALTSCATMVNGKYQQVKVDSFPGHAAIAVECGTAPHDGGFTPARLKLPRAAATCQVTLTKDGYNTRVFAFERQRSGALRVNAVAGAPVALVGALFGLVIGDFIGLDDGSDLASFGWGAGLELGAAPGRQIDKHTGGAWKWVPGDVFITLFRTEAPQ